MEKSVIKNAARGDKKSFKMIFDYYLPRMRPLALRYASNPHESEDILQDAFVKIYCNLHTYAWKGSFEGWIKAIVVNTALNYYKKAHQLYSIDNIDDLPD